MDNACCCCCHSCHRFPPGGSVNCILTQLENRLAPPHSHTATQRHFTFQFVCQIFFVEHSQIYFYLYSIFRLFSRFFFYRHPFRHHLRAILSASACQLCVQGIVNFARLAVSFFRALALILYFLSSFWESA